MNITFGWSYDGARWSNRTVAGTLGEVVAGPVQLAGILATRLACTIPEPDRPARIAAVRRAMGTALAAADTGPLAHVASSYQADPWSLARTMLDWRDQLVTAGWDGRAGQDASPRLTLLSQVNSAATRDPQWTPGAADQLRDVADILRDLAGSASGGADTWPLGITGIDLDNHRADLPPVWQRILTDLATLGVTVTEVDAPDDLSDLQVVTTDTEWDAATAGARLLNGALREKREPLTVVASRPTELLDRELSRRNLPQVGVRAASGERSFAQIVPVFLAAATAPPDIHAIGTLLQHTVTTTTINTDTDPGTGPVTVPVRLVPKDLRHALLGALSNEPGVGGPEWRKAIEATVQIYSAPETADPAKADLTRDLDRILHREQLAEETDPEGRTGYPVDTVTAHLSWLATRLAALDRINNGSDEDTESDSDLSRVAAGTRTAAEIVSSLGEELISPRELHAIVADCTPSTTSGGGAQASNLLDVVSSPAQLGTGSAEVLWWIPVDDLSSPAPVFRPAEITALADCGIELPDRHATASLVLDSHLRALRRRGRVCAILPTEVDGEAAAAHPALTFLADDLRRRLGATSLEDALADAKVPGARLTPDDATTPRPTDPVRPDPVERTIAPGEHLVPDYLSYSQWTSLLAHPLEWLLERQLGIRAGGLTDLPQGNQMIGTYLHAVVEGIVDDRLAGSEEPVTVIAEVSEIRERMDDLLPQYASPLLLPGQSRQRGIVLDHGTTAIHGLFTSLAAAGVRIAAAEAKYTTTIRGSRGAGGEELRLGGYRDLDVLLADGTRGVIDLKYTNSKKKYRELLEEGAALQLAVYAYSVADGGQLADVPVAYFSLKQNRMDTNSPAFGSPDILTVSPRDNGAVDADTLFDRAVTGVNRIFDDLRDGRVVDIGNILDSDEWTALGKQLKKAAGRGSLSPDDVIDASPYSPEQVKRYTEAVDAATNLGFIPTEIVKYTAFDLITGKTGDYSER